MATVVNKILLEISSYVTASAIAFAIDFCLLAALVSFAGVPYLAAAAISFAAGTVFVYWASVTRIFDFRRIGNPPREFGIFLAIGAVGLALNLGVMHVAVERVGLHYLAAKIVAASLTFGCNYALRRAVLFTQYNRTSGRDTRPESAP